MKKIILLFFALNGLFCSAQNQSSVRLLRGTVVDFVTNQPLLTGTKVQLLDKDSTYVTDGGIFTDGNRFQYKAMFDITSVH